MGKFYQFRRNYILHAIKAYEADLFLSGVCFAYKMSTNYIAICEREKSWKSRQKRKKEAQKHTGTDIKYAICLCF